MEQWWNRLPLITHTPQETSTHLAYQTTALCGVYIPTDFFSLSFLISLSWLFKKISYSMPNSAVIILNNLFKRLHVGKIINMFSAV